MISSGGEKGNRAGVGILMNERTSRALIVLRPASDRIITARFKTTIGQMTIVQVYTPTTAASGCEMAAFYEDLQKELNKAPTRDLVCVMKDFNAKVGNARTD